MAVTVPTTTRVCLNCKINSDANAGKEFYEIFNEVGLELQLPFLVKTFFHTDLNRKDKQHICDDCVNRLIELYDVYEHAKEKSCKTNILKNDQECSNNHESSKYFKNENGNLRYERENLHEPFVIDQKNTHFTLPQSNCIECTNIEPFVSTQEGNAVEIQYNKSDGKDRTEYFTQQQNQSSNAIADDFPDEDLVQTGKRKASQDFNISLSSSAIKDEKSDELESNEDMEFISDDENQNVEINKLPNANILFGSKKVEVDECQIMSNEEIEVLSEIKSETKDVLLYSDQNEFVDENICDEFINTADSNSLQKLKITEAKEALLLNTSSSATEFSNIEHIDADDFNEQDDVSDDTISVEEEYLVEEIILSEKYEQLDLNEYLDKVLITKFQDLLLHWEIECKLCLEKYNTFEELLNHACMAEFEKEQKFSCIIKDCEEHAKDLPTLARHLVLKHYDKLESTSICGKCTECQQIFLNVLELNKHSCCRNIKQMTGAPIYCKYCALNFQSFKRYVFHMQFHLKNHRPKICLLCGDLFNNSNDFFDHTHYKHYPKTAFVCLRCDCFFKDTKCLNNHIVMHEEPKFSFKCELCPKNYTSKRSLYRHMDFCHNKSKAFQCEYCSNKYAYKQSYLRHLNISHAADATVQTFVCSTCGLITNNMEIIKEHIESDKESPCFSSPVDKKMLGFGYSCENCSLDFDTIKHLKEHRLSDSHREDLFHCGMCRNSFNSLNHMRYHIIKNKDCKERQQSFPITRRLVCNIGDCEKFYTIRTYLLTHQTTNHKVEDKTSSPTEFKCQFCQQLLCSKKALMNHITRIHQSANLECSHCDKILFSQNSLQTHIYKYHTPVECYICLKTLKNRPNLKIHMNCVHNNIKRYFCRHCQKGYYNTNSRNHHEMKFHPQL